MAFYGVRATKRTLELKTTLPVWVQTYAITLGSLADSTALWICGLHRRGLSILLERNVIIRNPLGK